LPLLFVRLNRYLSQCGIGSRRGCEQIITEGRVSINSKTVTELATQVGPEDRVVVDGKSVKAEAGIVIALHKPRGFICTRNDTHGRTTIYDLLPQNLQTLHHVGRLDKESEGLILLTNRGDLSHRLIHPSQGAEKEYEVVVDKPMDQTVMAKLVKGMFTEEGFAKVERSWLDSDTRAHLVLKQGLKRQIRLMLYQLGFEVERLIRTRIGWLELRGLPRGSWKELTAAEVERFFSKEGGGRPGKAPTKPSATKGERLGDDDSDSSAPAKKRAARSGGKGGLTRRTPPPGRRSDGPKARPSRARRDDAPAAERPARGDDYDRPFSERPPARGRGERSSSSDRPARGPARGSKPSRSSSSSSSSSSERPSRGDRAGPPAKGRPTRGRPGGSPASGRSGTSGSSRKSPGKGTGGPRRGPPRR
jgi:23S rRNA pseudouridine2605 synthase